MGRTNPTFRDVLDDVRARWRPFRRGLRREDQETFDDLLEKAGAHADAAGYANPADPVTAVLLSVLLEQQADVDALADRLDEAEASLDGVETDARLAGTEAEARLTGLAERVDALEARIDGAGPPDDADDRPVADGGRRRGDEPTDTDDDGGADQARDDLAAAIDAFYR